MLTEKPELILNSDQSGFQLETHWQRTLEISGMKTVQGFAQSISATTHSYTICPMFSLDGMLFAPMFMVLQKPKGKFPQKGHFEVDELFHHTKKFLYSFKANNIKVLAGNTHIMTREMAISFIEDTVIPQIGNRKSLLLLDSWITWKSAFNPDQHPNLTVKYIPKNCTGLVQPADLYLFRLI